MELDNKIQIAKDVFKEYILRGKPFSYKEISEDIFSKGGIPMMDLCYTLSDHLKISRMKEVLDYDLRTEKFVVIKN